MNDMNVGYDKGEVRGVPRISHVACRLSGTAI